MPTESPIWHQDADEGVQSFNRQHYNRAIA